VRYDWITAPDRGAAIHVMPQPARPIAPRRTLQTAALCLAGRRMPPTGNVMKLIAALSTAVVLSIGLAAQETKPVPKDSVRVFVPGCAKGAMFTAGRRTEDSPGGAAVPEGTRLRMSGPKKLMSEIKAQEGTRIEITGLVKRGQYEQSGVRLGSGVRISGGPTGSTGGLGPNPVVEQVVIDVEGWRKVLGDCPQH
jgi:hypothetical protein